ncbi:MAG: hypothetical protein AAF636_04320 [Pseudomonadota bacterium]
MTQILSELWGVAQSDVSQLGAMEDESARRQRLLADTMLDYVPVNAVLKDLLGQNGRQLLSDAGAFHQER